MSGQGRGGLSAAPRQPLPHEMRLDRKEHGNEL
jgi:hypothetical protein